MRLVYLLTLLLGIGLVGTLSAQESSKGDEKKAAEKKVEGEGGAAKSEKGEADKTEGEEKGKAQSQKSAEEVLNELLRKKDQPTDVRKPVDAGAGKVGNKEGIAPNVKPQKLRREGQFILSRRGRMVATGRAAQPWQFVFEADKNGMSDPPMYLMPCRYLEDMERIVKREGDAAVFLISGQIFVYHNANYLLPTVMRQVVKRGNLKP